jgi:hypothetical protein
MTTPPPAGRRAPHGPSRRLAAIAAVVACLLSALVQLAVAPAAGAVELRYGPQAPYGLPAGVALTPSGPLTITTPGAVIDSLDIAGCVRVQADNVTIIRSRVTCDGAAAAITQSGGALGLNVVESLVQGGSVDPAGAGVWSDQAYAVIRSEIRNVTDGVFLGSWGTIEGSWVHDLTARPGEHNDLVQMTGGANAFVRNNLLEHRRDQTAAVMIKSDLGPIDNVIIENNVIAGGGFGVYVMAGNALGGCCDAPTNVAVWNNVFRAGSFLWGPLVSPGPTTVLCNKLDSGEPLTYVASTSGAGAQVNGCPYPY